MKSKIRLYFALLMLMLFLGCGKNTALEPISPDPVSLVFGTESTLDIVTWNLQLFPRTDTDKSAIAQMIATIDADIIAFQEIMDYNAFVELASMLPNYNAYVYNATSSYRLAYLYDNRTITVRNNYTIYNGQSTPFPRPPYVLEVTWRGNDYYIINNHLKAYDDNVIVEGDPYDNEYRRKLACQKLHQYISTTLPNDRVVVLGDMNDQLADPPEYNVFMTFIDAPDESYPSYTSHIDHILITNELFEDFAATDSYCRTIRAETWFSSLTEYKKYVSDHRPVGIRLAEPAK
jgi:endonuclease/exonuclease/phosphatase family metal-dependent hydrolase